MQLLVLGMHRSGTSAVTRLLNMAGCYFGPEGSSTRVLEENPKGFWERRDVRAVCDSLLQDAGFDWWKVTDFELDAISEEVREAHLPPLAEIVHGLDAHRPWVLKEPRLCLLLPLLRPMLEVPLCIHVTREPTEVAESLRSRNDFPLPVGIALWERYTLASVQSSAELPRYHITYGDVLTDPSASLLGLLDWLEQQGVRGMHRPTDREIAAFIVPDLHRSRSAADDRSELLNAPQLELAVAIDRGELFDSHWQSALASKGAIATLRDFEASQLREARLGHEVETLRARSESAERAFFQWIDDTVADVGAHTQQAERQLGAIRSSRAWRLARTTRDLQSRLRSGSEGGAPGLSDVTADLARLRGRIESRAATAKEVQDRQGSDTTLEPGSSPIEWSPADQRGSTEPRT